ncbi:bifunctional UDP-sugar hydrolase/5'-nucleotidase periplasmic [Enterobacter ludwigii]|nr:bifunctional UDP-sugar hydrolase/5'-nucleotidase periplasmic [Enterobacter ludwigii]
MKLMKRSVALALIAAWGLVSLPVQAYEKDKTYKITILHTNDHHGHFWRSEYGEYGLSAQKTLVDGIRKEVAAQGAAYCCCRGAISIPVCRNLIYRMRSLISAA